jgi:hypothetical protein
MQRTWTAVATLFAAAGLVRGETRRAVFEGAGTETTWQIQDLNPDLPSDWSSFGFLVLELRISSPQRFELRVHDAQGVRSVRLSPLPGAWVRGAVPLGFLTQPARQGNDMAAVYNKARPMMWINLSGTQGPLTAVREIGVALPNPVGTVTLEIRSVRLAREDPGDALLERGPLVDEFGQWIHDEWPGKAASLDQLKASWAAEEKAFQRGAAHLEILDRCQYGGFKTTEAKATGFFRVEKIAGIWWFVDPDGHFFLSMGADSMGTSVTTSTQGREQLFAALPPADAGGRGGASFYVWNLVRRFGPDWVSKWIALTARRMAAWGFNTVGNWSDQRLADGFHAPYVYTSRGWGETGPMGIADVYAPNFAETVDRAAAQQCDARKDDPYLLGYFLGNEPPWPGRESVAVDAILAGPQSSLQQELRKFLGAWDTPGDTPGDTPDRRREFLYGVYGKFVETVTAAIRRHDPNHLILGLRFGSTTPVEMVRLSKIFDVYSLNNYAYTVNQREIDKVREAIDRPILIGEFHFGVPGRGMPPGLKQTANQDERGVAYRYYVENALADRNIVGAHWFEWVDEPSTGRFDGENYNIGLVDVTDRPYSELVEAALATHRRLLDVHSGKEAAVTRQAKVQ